jgi:hypothetical protein
VGEYHGIGDAIDGDGDHGFGDDKLVHMGVVIMWERTGMTMLVFDSFIGNLIDCNLCCYFSMYCCKL